MARLRQAAGWALNLCLPGLGLIVLRREWLGLSLAVVYGICGNVALAGWLIAPAAVPAWLTLLAFVLTVLTWLAGQLLHWRQMQSQSRCESDMRVLLHEAQCALEKGEIESARVCLESAFALDDEHVELHLLRARLFALEGDHRAARKALRRATKLDVGRRHHAAAERGAEALRAGRSDADISSPSRIDAIGRCGDLIDPSPPRD
jgi:hypothetical protein